MSLVAQVTALAQVIAADIKSLYASLAGKLDATAKAADSARLGGALASTFMQLGDAGIGKNSTPSLADLNSAAITGINSYGAAAANRPPSTATSTGGVVLTVYFNNTNAVQWASPYGASEQWIRTMVGGVWGVTWTRTQGALVSGENIKTVNGQSLLGEGDIEIEASGGGGGSGLRWRLSYMLPRAGSTTIDTLGVTFKTPDGTPTARSVSSASAFMLMQRVDFVKTVAAGQSVDTSVGVRGLKHLRRGYGMGVGGFRLVCRFGFSAGVTEPTNEAFVGVTGDDNLINRFALGGPNIGVGWLAGDTEIYLLHKRLGSSTPTKIPTGIPRPVSDGVDVYEAVISCSPDEDAVSFELKNLVTGATFSGKTTVNNNLPSPGQLLAPVAVLMPYSPAAAVTLGFSLMSLYLESGS